MASILLPVSGAQVELADHAPLKMREFRAWMKAEQEVDFPAQYAFIHRFVTDWGGALNGSPPSDPNSLDDLDWRDFQALSKGVSALIQRTASEKN